MKLATAILLVPVFLAIAVDAKGRKGVFVDRLLRKGGKAKDGKNPKSQKTKGGKKSNKDNPTIPVCTDVIRQFTSEIEKICKSPQDYDKEVVIDKHTNRIFAGMKLTASKSLLCSNFGYRFPLYVDDTCFTNEVYPSEGDFADASNLELYFTQALGYVLSSQENVKSSLERIAFLTDPDLDPDLIEGQSSPPIDLSLSEQERVVAAVVNNLEYGQKFELQVDAAICISINDDEKENCSDSAQEILDISDEELAELVAIFTNECDDPGCNNSFVSYNFPYNFPVIVESVSKYDYPLVNFLAEFLKYGALPTLRPTTGLIPLTEVSSYCNNIIWPAASNAVVIVDSGSDEFFDVLLEPVPGKYAQLYLAGNRSCPVNKSSDLAH